MSWLSRLKNALNSRRLDDDLSDEIRDHLERRTDALRKQGLDPDEARHKAQARFGNATLLREQSRGLRLWTGLEGTLQDIRYSWRGMCKAPGFALTVVLSLALAIGANTAIYSIVDAAILRPLPVGDPGRLFRLSFPSVSDPGSLAESESDWFSYPEYLQFTAAAAPVARLALFSSPGRAETHELTARAPIEKINRAYVSGGAFEMLGIQPAAGRLFSTTEDRIPQDRAVAVLSYDYWRRRFGQDPAVVGRSIAINEKAVEIIGVAREGFWSLENWSTSGCPERCTTHER